MIEPIGYLVIIIFLIGFGVGFLMGYTWKEIEELKKEGKKN